MDALQLDSWVAFGVIIATLQIMEAVKRHRNTRNKTLKFTLHHLLLLFFGVTGPNLASKDLKTVKLQYKYLLLIRAIGRMCKEFGLCDGFEENDRSGASRENR